MSCIQLFGSVYLSLWALAFIIFCFCLDFGEEEAKKFKLSRSHIYFHCFFFFFFCLIISLSLLSEFKFFLVTKHGFERDLCLLESFLPLMVKGFFKVRFCYHFLRGFQRERERNAAQVCNKPKLGIQSVC